VPTKYVKVREARLRAALKKQDVEALFWWIVKEHEGVLLAGEKSHLSPGLFRLALDHLASLHKKRVSTDKPEQGDASVAELEAAALRLLG